MKKATKRTLGLLLALCMALALAACGKGKPNSPSQSASGAPAASSTVQQPVVPEAPEPAAPDMNSLLSADAVEYLVECYEKDGSNDYTHWYPDGDKFAAYYLMFEDDSDLAVCDASGVEYYSTKIENGHVVNFLDDPEDDPELDFVFVDNLTCYDLVNDQWYMSADYDVAFASLTAATFYNSEGGETWDITFYEDGTYLWNYGDDADDSEEGTWWFNYAHEVGIMPPDASYEDRFNLCYAPDSWEVVAVEHPYGYDSSDVYYPAA